MRLIDPDKGTFPAESGLGADKCSVPTCFKLEGQIQRGIGAASGLPHLSFGYSHSPSVALRAQQLDLTRKRLIYVSMTRGS